MIKFRIKLDQLLYKNQDTPPPLLNRNLNK